MIVLAEKAVTDRRSKPTARRSSVASVAHRTIGRRAARLLAIWQGSGGRGQDFDSNWDSCPEMHQVELQMVQGRSRVMQKITT